MGLFRKDKLSDLLSDEELIASWEGRKPSWSGYKAGQVSRSFQSSLPSSSTGFYGEFLKEVDENVGEEEKIVEKYTRKLLARGGWKRDEARRRLLSAIIREREKGGN